PFQGEHGIHDVTEHGAAVDEPNLPSVHHLHHVHHAAHAAAAHHHAAHHPAVERHLVALCSFKIRFRDEVGRQCVWRREWSFAQGLAAVHEIDKAVFEAAIEIVHHLVACARLADHVDYQVDTHRRSEENAAISGVVRLNRL